MIITNTTTICFNPNTEGEAIERFYESNDLSEWQVDISTVSVSFTLKKLYIVEVKSDI